IVSTNYNPIRIYPNPVNDQLFIEGLEKGNTEILLFNMYGQLVMEQNIISGGNVKMNISSQASGIYKILITNNERNTTFTLIIE
ncbi:MAG: T9SS type A sorting domain-containing protein, partial [Vicingaceae bacterium]